MDHGGCGFGTIPTEFEIRAFFIGKDVAGAIGYKDTASAVSTHCKHGFPIGVGESPTPLGIDPQTIIIPEGDVYRLIIRSKLPAAERFERWVMDEVLPTIRQTGRYGSPSHKEAFNEEPQTADSLKLRKVTLVLRIFGERSAAQLYSQLGLERVPAMAAAFAQIDLFEPNPPGTVTVTVTPNGHLGGAA